MARAKLKLWHTIFLIIMLPIAIFSLFLSTKGLFEFHLNIFSQQQTAMASTRHLIISVLVGWSLFCLPPFLFFAAMKEKKTGVPASDKAWCWLLLPVLFLMVAYIFFNKTYFIKIAQSQGYVLCEVDRSKNTRWGTTILIFEKETCKEISNEE